MRHDARTVTRLQALSSDSRRCLAGPRPRPRRRCVRHVRGHAGSHPGILRGCRRPRSQRHRPRRPLPPPPRRTPRRPTDLPRSITRPARRSSSCSSGAGPTSRSSASAGSGRRGFAGVQVSPPQEHALIDDGTNHFPWWQRYQAVSYRIESRSGTSEEFADMTRRCAAVGVDIYADTLVNHMTALEAGTGSAGSTFTKYEYPGIHAPPDFHANPDPAHPDVLCDRSIADFGNPEEVHTCELLGLADLRTEDDQVQDRLATYMADLYALGARGLPDRCREARRGRRAGRDPGSPRARSCPPARSSSSSRRSSTRRRPGSPAYYDTGRVDEFTYSVGITGAFLNRNGMTLAGLQPPESFPFLAPSDNAVPFVDNHDSQRGRIGRGLFLTYKRAGAVRPRQRLHARLSVRLPAPDVELRVQRHRGGAARRTRRATRRPSTQPRTRRPSRTAASSPVSGYASTAGRRSRGWSASGTSRTTAAR